MRAIFRIIFALVVYTAALPPVVDRNKNISILLFRIFAKRPLYRILGTPAVRWFFSCYYSSYQCQLSNIYSSLICAV